MSQSISSLAPSLSNTKIATGQTAGDSQPVSQRDPSSDPSSLTSGGEQQPSKKQIEAVVNSLNEFVKPHQTSIQFKLYDKLNEYYIQVTDKTTNTVIQTIPSKQLLDVYSAMMHYVGVMFDKKA